MAVYFYMSDFSDAARNLAVDEYFLSSLGEDDILLYLYINSNAVIIGKGQNAWKECDVGAMEKDSVQLVRRHTGGGAVYHDGGNLNFSFVAGEKNYDLDRQTDVIIKTAARFGIEAEKSGRNDLLTNGRKFSGNAFAVKNGIKAHHGTLLISTDLDRLTRYLNVSQKKIESKGIKSVRSRVCDLCEFSTEANVPAFAEALEAEFQKQYGKACKYSFDSAELREIERLYKKHTSWEYVYGKTPAFDFKAEYRTSYGGVELLFRVKEGFIHGVTVYTDSLDVSLPAKLEKMLSGVRFTPEDVASVLSQNENGPEFIALAEEIEKSAF